MAEERRKEEVQRRKGEEEGEKRIYDGEKKVNKFENVWNVGGGKC